MALKPSAKVMVVSRDGELRAQHTKLSRLTPGDEPGDGLILEATRNDGAPHRQAFQIPDRHSGVLGPLQAEQRPDTAGGGLTNLLRDGWIGQGRATKLSGDVSGTDAAAPIRCNCLQCSLPSPGPDGFREPSQPDTTLIGLGTTTNSSDNRIDALLNGWRIDLRPGGIITPQNQYNPSTGFSQLGTSLHLDTLLEDVITSWSNPSYSQRTSNNGLFSSQAFDLETAFGVDANGDGSVGTPAEMRTGIDPSGSEPDIEIQLNPGYLANELWFDRDPLLRTAPVPPDKTDGISMFMHKLDHVFSFNGWMNDTTGTMAGDYQSPFDEKVSSLNGNLFFTGSRARGIYGSSVPLTYRNHGYLDNASSRPGSDLIPDLMNGVVFNRGANITYHL